MKFETLTKDCPSGYYEGHYRYGALQPIWWDGEVATLSRGTTTKANLDLYEFFLGPMTPPNIPHRNNTSFWFDVDEPNA